MTQPSTDDQRINQMRELSPPAEIIARRPRSERASATVSGTRQVIHEILAGQDDRLVVIVGPCSIHDPHAARDYARRLASERARHAGDLEVIMRVYFEKPRTTVGWKGLINDPGLDGSFRIDEGLETARGLLADINELGLPAGCEFLDMITPQYIADLVGWGAIGARTTESQLHRELASGLSCPVGFKNGTGGDVGIAVDAIRAASQPHHFMAVTKEGRAAIAATAGNEDCHVVLRGGPRPNYGAQAVAETCQALARAGLAQKVMIDASHANSAKNPANQPAVIEDVCRQLEGGDHRIFGLMVESNLVGGRQDLRPGEPLVYGQSITDGCIGWEETVQALERLALAVRGRRNRAGDGASAAA